MVARIVLHPALPAGEPQRTRRRHRDFRRPMEKRRQHAEDGKSEGQTCVLSPPDLYFLYENISTPKAPTPGLHRLITGPDPRLTRHPGCRRAAAQLPARRPSFQPVVLPADRPQQPGAGVNTADFPATKSACGTPHEIGKTRQAPLHAVCDVLDETLLAYAPRIKRRARRDRKALRAGRFLPQTPCHERK